MVGMSLISTFYVGPAKEIAAALRDRPETADEEFPSLQTSALFQSGIDAACRELGRIRGKRSAGLNRYVAEVLDGDGEESQVVRLKPAFVTTFAALTKTEAAEISRRLVEKDEQEDHAFRQRQFALASKPIQSKRDLLALIIMPVFAWSMALRMGTTSRAAILIGAVAGLAFLALTFLVLPWIRRRKISPERSSQDDYAPSLSEIAELCRKAERDGLDVVYEWSL
jgi:hypothetical protein